MKKLLMAVSLLALAVFSTKGAAPRQAVVWPKIPIVIHNRTDQSITVTKDKQKIMVIGKNEKKELDLNDIMNTLVSAPHSLVGYAQLTFDPRGALSIELILDLTANTIRSYRATLYGLHGEIEESSELIVNYPVKDFSILITLQGKDLKDSSITVSTK